MQEQKVSEGLWATVKAGCEDFFCELWSHFAPDCSSSSHHVIPKDIAV